MRSIFLITTGTGTGTIAEHLTDTGTWPRILQINQKLPYPIRH
jgi:hypothetical protein